MKLISLTLKNDNGSIGYSIDAEAGTYSSGTYDADGLQLTADEGGPIDDPMVLAKRLYLVVLAALSESVH